MIGRRVIGDLRSEDRSLHGVEQRPVGRLEQVDTVV
jgi:hypothetical protein